ncbi:MAG: hypothetical protein L0241_31210, partial [Planctomycetia bacterium]|nr:hypothetical protein [Planctomycetia bacterium]
DLATVRKTCLAGVASGPLELELCVIPISQLKPDDLPRGFRGDLRKRYAELPYWQPNIQQHKLPDKPPFGRLLPPRDRVGHWRVSANVDGTPTEYGAVLRHFSPVLVTGVPKHEQSFLRFLEQAGTVLLHHRVSTERDAFAAWIAALIGYLWKTPPRQDVSDGFARIGDLWRLSLRTIDGLLGTATATIPENAMRPRRPGPKRKPLTKREETLLDMYDKGWRTIHKSYYELAEAAGDGWNAVTAERFIRRVRQRQKRDRNAKRSST